MAKRSNELERLAHEAVEHQARHAQKKAAAFLGVLISNAQHDGSTSDGLSRKQRASVCDLPKNQSPRRKDGKETGEQATFFRQLVRGAPAAGRPGGGVVIEMLFRTLAGVHRAFVLPEPF